VPGVRELLVADADQEPIDGTAVGLGLTTVLGFECVTVLLSVVAEEQVEPATSLL